MLPKCDTSNFSLKEKFILIFPPNLAKENISSSKCVFNKIVIDTKSIKAIKSLNFNVHKIHF